VPHIGECQTKSYPGGDTAVVLAINAAVVALSPAALLARAVTSTREEDTRPPTVTWWAALLDASPAAVSATVATTLYHVPDVSTPGWRYHTLKRTAPPPVSNTCSRTYTPPPVVDNSDTYAMEGGKGGERIGRMGGEPTSITEAGTTDASTTVPLGCVPSDGMAW
jgi:hypothetical protein